MPTGPKGQKRPADVIGNAVKVMRIGADIDYAMLVKLYGEAPEAHRPCRADPVHRLAGAPLSGPSERHKPSPKIA
jgi:hypothetical protein